MRRIFMIEPSGAVLFQEEDAKTGRRSGPRRVISVIEAVKLLGRSQRHLYRLMERGWLRPVAFFANQHFLDLSEVQALVVRHRARAASVPQRLAYLFPEYDARALEPRRDANLILSRILERGDRKALRWARAHYGLRLIKECLAGPGARLLSERTYHFWCWLWKVPPAPHRDWRAPGRTLGRAA